MKFLLLLGLLGSFLTDQTPVDKLTEIKYSWVDRPIPVREVTVKHKGRPQTVVYKAYIPVHDQGDQLPVLVCVGGLISDGGDFIHSDPRDCFDDHFFQFADDHKFVILGVGFKFVISDWPSQSSYQFAKVWSGKALLKILEDVKKDVPIDDQALYMYGISAGAQFSIRFATLWPKMVRAVAAHAAGGYDEPNKKIPTRFLITVGEEDNDPVTRREFAKRFTQSGRKAGMDIQLEIIPGLNHRQTEEQNEMSRKFFLKVHSQDE